jgi:hypothetical protein
MDNDPILSADQIAQSFGYANFASIAQQEIVPNRTQILGVGATAAALGKEFAFFRSSIHWTNVAPAYTDPDILPIVDTEQDDNIEFQTWDLQALTDIYPEEHFDRIYCHGNDLKGLDPQALRDFGKALVGLLAKGGVIHISQIDSNFIENAVYRNTMNNLTFSKPKATVIEPYMTQLPRDKSPFVNRWHRRALPKFDKADLHKPLDAISNLAARAIMAGYRTAGALYEYSQRKK